MKISFVQAREILDSRGNPTVEADVKLASGVIGRAAVPSGASTGSKEAIELRDGGDRYMGKGVRQAVNNVNSSIAQSVVGMQADKQQEVDAKMIELDATDNKSNLGANAILAVSLACAKAAALEKGQSLFHHIASIYQGDKAMTMPVPMMNIINGGAHADNTIDFQEFMIQPVAFESFSEALRCGVEIFHSLKRVLHGQGLQTAVGDEGGFAPNLQSTSQALAVIAEAVDKAGYSLGKEVTLALDCASTEFHSSKGYCLENKYLNGSDMVNYLTELCKNYPIVSIEDGLAEDDWQSWKQLTDAIGDRVQLVGDDLFVTNSKILRQGIDGGVANSILIKVNQIGTLTETLDAINMAQKAGYAVVISHRSGETEDSSISDLAVATGAGQIKTGSLSRSDRVAKYNQLLRIEEEMAGKLAYQGLNAIRCRL